MQPFTFFISYRREDTAPIALLLKYENVYTHVTVSLTTWDARRKVTIYDLNLALYMNMAANTILKR